MTIESVTYISDLNATYPAAGDLKSEGDDHIRNLKTGIKTTFPNVSGAVSPTHTEFNYVVGVTSAIQTQINAKATAASPVLTGQVSSPLGAVGAPTYTFTGDLDTGMWSPAANTLAWSGSGAEIFRTDANGLLVKATARLASEALTVAKVGASYSVFDDGTVQGIYGTDGTTAIMGALSNHAAVIRTNNTAKLTVTNDGRVYGSALHNSAGAVTGTTNQYIASGTYTPTLTNGTNVAASTARLCHWMRVGNVVTVAGTFDVDATSAGGVQTILSLSLPIASNFTAATDAGGTAVSTIRAGGTTSDSGLIGQIQGDATNDRAIIYWNEGSGNNITASFTFTYVVL